MYRQKAFELSDIAALHDFIDRRHAGHVVSVCDGEIVASLLPLVLDRSRGELGTLIGHFARANPQWKHVETDRDGMVIFTGPDAYVSPNWYASKAEHGKVVPTWNYVTVHAYGPLVVHDDKAFVDVVVRRLTARHEAGRPAPWSVDDAPPSYVDAMLGAIVGVEIPITRIEGAQKLSQNRAHTDVDGVIAGLSVGGTSEQAIAGLMRANQDEL